MKVKYAGQLKIAAGISIIGAGWTSQLYLKPSGIAGNLGYLGLVVFTSSIGYTLIIRGVWQFSHGGQPYSKPVLDKTRQKTAWWIANAAIKYIAPKNYRKWITTLFSLGFATWRNPQALEIAVEQMKKDFADLELAEQPITDDAIEKLLDQEGK